VAETGFGVRLDTYRFTDDELHRAIERLLADASLRKRADELGSVIRARSGTRHAADLLEGLVS
jgi:UDP:flavonoid glycosyltransferase YjiC (YdhE family)